jgi:hypothetical protein
MQGINVFIWIWGAGLAFFAVNIHCLSQLIEHHRVAPALRDDGSIAPLLPPLNGRKGVGRWGDGSPQHRRCVGGSGRAAEGQSAPDSRPDGGKRLERQRPPQRPPGNGGARARRRRGKSPTS